MPSLSRAIPLCSLALLLGLGACQAFRDSAGLTKAPPDEFAVVTKAPLVVPPDFNLRPPSLGAAPLNQEDPGNAAQDALFNTADPQTVANRMSGNFSPAEKLLLANAGVQNANPTIRGELQSDAPGRQGADGQFVNKLLASPSSASTKASGANPASTRKSSGWFDWF